MDAQWQAERDKTGRRWASKGLGAIRSATAREFQKLRRLQAADYYGRCACVSCGRVNHWKAMDGGHFISRVHNATLFEPANVNPQCPNCNRFPDGGTMGRYRGWIVKNYSRATLNKLERLKNTHVSFTRDELLDKLVTYRLQIKALLEYKEFIER